MEDNLEVEDNLKVEGNLKLSPHDRCLGTLCINSTCRLKIEDGKWFLHVPVKVGMNDTVPNREFCSLDPGVCNFQTVYSEEQTYKVEVNKELIGKLQSKLDTFQSMRSKKLISKSHYDRRTRSIYRRMTNLIDDIHYKLIDLLTKSYQNIFLPIFESQEIVKKMFGKRSRRTLLALKHYQFKQRLRAKCARMKYSAVYDCTEEYTSKTCSRCGELNNSLGCSRVFKCHHCALNIDRDINGARNITIKIFKEFDSLPMELYMG